MKKFLNCYLLASLMMAVASCSSDEDWEYGDADVSDRLYNTYIVGMWELVEEYGYADFNKDGLNEEFAAGISGGGEVWNSEDYKTVLVFKSDGRVDIVPYHPKALRYEFDKAHKCRYAINVHKQRDGSGEGYLHIYDGKHFDKTYTITLFKERYIELKLVSEGQMVVFRFEYQYQNK